MRPTSSIVVAFAIAITLLCAWFVSSEKPGAMSVLPPPVRTLPAVVVAQQEAEVKTPATAPVAVVATASAPAPDEVRAFAEWTERYLAADAETRAGMLAEGRALAAARRPVFKELIKEDPKAALAHAVPMVARQKLPAELLALLEDRVNGIGVLRVLQGTPPEGEPLPVGSLTFREVEMQAGKTYRAYVYGRREQVLTWTAGASLNGVAMDADFAVNEMPSRTLEIGEIPPADKPAVVDCPVSGKQVFEDADAITDVITVDTPAVETAIEVQYFCNTMHIDVRNQTMIMGEGVSGGTAGFTGILPAAPTPALGNVKVIVIPMTYADQNAIPSTEAALYTTLRDVADHYSKASYGRLSLAGVVTPPVKLKHNEAWYVNRDTTNGGDISGTNVEMAEAREEARKLGFDFNDYDCTVLRHNGGPGSYGGLGGGSTVWVRGDSTGLWAHEIGHCFGLGHANFWDTAGTSSIGNGANQEYGDVYDIMGSSGSFPNGHYNTQFKNAIRWLPGNYLLPVTQSGVYRIYAYDQGTLDPTRRYALNIVKDAQRVYWGEVHSLFETNPWVKNGMVLGWRFPNGGGNFQLIDTTNGSPFAKEDAPVSLGNTFSDTESGIHMTLVAANETPRYMDVQVNFGSYPTNQRPTMTLASSAAVVPLNATVTFTATASDPDGDELAFAWQHFGNASTKIVSPNANVITRQFTVAGSYVVACTVSDMKGGTVTRSQLITVGTSTTFTISGRVTLLGAGLQDVVVLANGANGVVTDADGYFTIPNLSANNYTLTPLLYGYSFGELFNNSITVGPNFTGANFEATAQAVVTIAATTPSANELVPVTPGTFRISRTGDTSQLLVVNVNTALGSATKTTDYTFTPDYVTGSQGFSTFTIPADADSVDVTVTPVTDSTVEGPETVTLQLGPGNGYLVSTPSTATVTISDDDTTLPRVAITATVNSTMEGLAAPGVLTLTRTGPTTADLAVSYTVGGTASSGGDFTTLSGTVTIPTGSATAAVNVAAVNDAVSEPLKTVVLTLAANAAAYVVDSTASTAAVNLYDDDTQLVTVGVTDASAREVDLTVPGAQADTGTFVVTRSGDTAAPLTVYYAFAGTYNTGVMALHGVDFDPLPGSVVIPAGKTQASITVLPRFDGIGEGPEQAVLYLGANATNYVLGESNTAVVTIEDNAGDVPYIDVVNTASAAEPSSSGIFRFNYRGSAAALPLQVNYTLSGTAVNGTDYNGGTIWAQEPSGGNEALNGYSGAWAVGHGGRILRWGGVSNGWQAHTSGTTSTLWAVWTWDGSNAWAVGEGGVIRRWNGTAWSAQTSGTTNTLRGVWGANASNVWAVGDGGTILRWNGSAWSAQTSGVTTALHAVWTASTTVVWAVGEGGVIRRWNGSAWSAQVSGTTETLLGVWGTSTSNIWTVGNGGVILRGNGTTWSTQTSPVTTGLSSVWGADASNLWATGVSGTLLRTSNGGTLWTPQVTNQTVTLNAIQGNDANNIWAVGDGGTILHRWTATAGQALSGQIIIPSGTTFADLTVNPVNDTTAEDLESVTLSITPDAAYQTFAPTSTASMWLRDNDNVNTVFVDTQVGTTGSWNVAENTVTNPTKFYISRTGSTTAALTVSYTIGGTATSGSDYTALSGSVVIPAGSLGVDVPVAILDDAVFEGVETITFDFAPGGYSRSAGTLMYINDNDTATATVGFQAPSSSGPESVSPVSIPVTLSAAQATPVTVQYVVNGTNTSSSSTTANRTLPFWVRVVKTGGVVTHFESHDGVIWTQRGGNTNQPSLGSSYMAGIGLASGSSTATTASIDNFTVTGLSAGGSVGSETAANYGTVNGTHTVANGVYSFNSSGSTILTSATDNFRFVYVPVTNSANCTVTARVVSLGTTSSSARVGVMLRSTTSTSSVATAAMAGSGTPNQPYVLANRGAAGATAVSTNYTTMVLPYWYRLVRAGDTFATAYSKDGATWSTLGTTQTLAMGPSVLAGLMVTANSDGALATATFDNVTINGVAETGLLGRTVGFVNEQGSESLSGGVWTVNGSGAGITGTNDEGYWVAREVGGDFTLIGRVTSLTGGANGAEAGVMARHTRDGYSRSMYAGLVKSNPTHAQRYRLQSFSNASGSGVDFTLAPGTLTFAPGETLQNIVLNVTNDTMDEANNLVSLQLLNATGASVLAAGTYHGYTIVDDDSAPANPYVGFAATASTVPESAGVVTLPLSLSAPATQDGQVNYAVTGGSATGGGVDHTLASGTLNFATGESVQGIQLSITEDALRESPETIVITLSSPVNLQLGSNFTHTLTITDNDLPVVTVVATDDTASEAGAENGLFTLSRTGDTTDALVVTLVRGGTATDGTDHATIATTQTLPAGSASIPIQVVPVDDALNEGTETVVLTVAADAAYVVGTPSAATVSLLDDDRSTVTLVANDDTAAEGGGAGQFTLTRTAPTNVALAVALTIAGTASNGTDYASIATPVSIPIGQTSVTVNVTPTEDGTTEGDEQVTLSLNTGSYDIGGASFGVVTIVDNDNPPTLFINSPASQGPLIASGNGVILSATITDDGAPAPVTQMWTQISGPGVATIEQPTAATTAVTFSAPGTYILRITATDTQFTVSDQTTVVVGSGLVAADWITQDLGPSSARRGQGVEFGGQFSVTGTGAGYASQSNDGAHVMVRQISGDGSVVARLTSLSLSTGLGGVTIRDSMARGSRRAVLGYVPGTGLQFRARATSVSVNDTVVATQASGLSLPLWLKLERVAGTNAITASYAADVGGTAGTWTQIGTTTTVTMFDAAAEFGLTTTSNSTATTATALFDHVALTPVQSGPALLSEDANVSPAAAGSGTENGGTTTLVGSTNGYYHGWQFYGDMVVTARLATYSSGAGSSTGGIRVAESMESGAQLHLGRMPTSAYNGYTWTSLAGGSNGGVPSSIAAGQWMRITRRGNSITAYRAPDSGGNPGTWIQIGQPQTVIMTTPIWVGYYVNNSSGVGMNTCTFSGLSILPLNKAPVVDIASVATWPLSPVPLDGSVTDDSQPAPVSLTSLWSKRSGPGGVTFGSATLTDTSATLSQAGAYVLRLTADDGGIQSFKDLAFTGYTKPFEVWQGQNWAAAGGFGAPSAAQSQDADFDGQMNLLEYAFGTAPQTAGGSPVVQDTATVGPDKFLRLTVPKNPNAPDVTFTVEATSTLAAPASWSSAGLVIESDTSTQLIVRDNVPVAPGARRFMRVRVEQVP